MLISRVNSQLNERLPLLGFGLFRLPMNGDRDSFPTKVYELLDHALEQGVNYFDTGWNYLNNHSERLVHETLIKRHPREEYFISAKLPTWLCHSRENMEYYFNTQLEYLGVEYIDFYLLHALNKKVWEENRNKGVLEFLEEKKRLGKIRHVGFSFHDSPAVLQDILRSYPWEFNYLQLNYYDWLCNDAKELYDITAAQNVATIVMEPLRGGTLCKLPSDVEKALLTVHPDWSPAKWGLHFVASLPNVAMILSGMNELKQLEENVETLSFEHNLTQDESGAVVNAGNVMRSRQIVPCTGCGYCVDSCPAKIPIPTVLRGLNEAALFENEDLFYTVYDQKAEECIGCSACAARCPQKINIPYYIQTANEKYVKKVLNLSADELKNRIKPEYTIVCFGAGADGKAVLCYLKDKHRNLLMTCNTEARWGTELNGVRVISPEELNALCRTSIEKVFILITTSKHRDAITAQLKEMDLFKYVLN